MLIDVWFDRQAVGVREVIMRMRTFVVTLVALSLLWSSSAMAQQRHVIDPAAMRQAIADQAMTDQQNRGAVLGLLQQSQVRDVAGRLGLSVTDAESAVSTLTSAELAGLAGAARAAGTQLAGGSTTIVISTTTALLILIIVLIIAL
jgi:hypothetical protein